MKLVMPIILNADLLCPLRPRQRSPTKTMLRQSRSLSIPQGLSHRSGGRTESTTTASTALKTPLNPLGFWRVSRTDFFLFLMEPLPKRTFQEVEPEGFGVEWENDNALDDFSL
jgi:hypothetical protein